MPLTARLSRLTPRRLAVLAVVALVVAGTVIAMTTPDDVPVVGSVGAADSDKSAETAARSNGPMTDMAAAPPPPGRDGSTVMRRQVSGSGQTSASPTVVEGGGSSFVPGAQRIVRTADLRVQVARNGFDAAFDRASSIATANGGFVAGSSTSSFVEPDRFAQRKGDDRAARSGELTIRIPVDRFDGVRQALAGLGEVQGQSIRGEDVSGQLVDYEARLRSLGAQEEALRTLLGKATAVGEVIQVQSQLFSVREQIEQLTAQRADLEQRAAMATISVSIFEPGAALTPIPEPTTGLAHSFERAVEGAVAVVGGMIVAVGWSLPLVALGTLIWAAVRLRRRSVRSTVPSGPPVTAP